MSKAVLITGLIVGLILAVLIAFYLAAVLGKNPNKFDVQGVKVEILKRGSGEAAKAGDSVVVHYIGTLQDGKKIDSSYDRNTPFSFTLGQGKVIKGWELGVVGMKVGEKRKLTVPSQLAYGELGFPNLIPKNAGLIFEIEMLQIKK